MYNGDFLSMPIEISPDLIITSPPYNVGIEYDIYNDNKPYNEYLNWCKNWLNKLYIVSKKDTRLCINIPLDTSKNGSVYGDYIELCRSVGWKYKSSIVWAENNISSGFCKGSIASASAPYVITPVEMILILYKENWAKENKGESDMTTQEYLRLVNGLWAFNGEKRNGHPAPFPQTLSNRLIKLFSFVGEYVFDPFFWSGTTLVSAKELHRDYGGCELSKNYFHIAQDRLLSMLNF